jgi:hypothetical protein
MLEQKAGSNKVAEIYRLVMAEPLVDSPEWLQTYNFFPNDLLSGSHESAPFK